MNRKQFLKRLGIGAAAVIVAPKVVAETSKHRTTGVVTDLFDVPKGTSPKKIMDIYRQTGDLIYTRRSDITYGVCYLPPYTVVRVYDEVAPKKSSRRRYRVVGIKEGNVFLCHFTDRYARLPFDIPVDSFYKNFIHILRFPKNEYHRE